MRCEVHHVLRAGVLQAGVGYRSWESQLMKADRVVIIGDITPNGLRVAESYFFIGRRVMNRKRWMEVRG